MPPSRGRSWSRLAAITVPFFRSEARWRAWGLLALLLGLILTMNALNVRNSFVISDLTTTVERRQADRFLPLALFYFGVFAASTTVAGFWRFIEERLGLRWRDWLTQHLLGRYLAHKAYYRLNSRADVDNPDQRIAEDAKLFTTGVLNYFLVVINSLVTVFVFLSIGVFLAALLRRMVLCFGANRVRWRIYNRSCVLHVRTIASCNNGTHKQHGQHEEGELRRKWR